MIFNGIENENGLQFIATEEGRIRPRSSFTYSPATQYVYDYFIKDHLGNIRAVVTNEIQRRSYFATMESSNATAEEELFYNISATRINLPANYPNDPTTPTNLQVSGLNAGTGKVFGPAKVLGIMEGDRVDINTKYFFVGGQMAGSGPGNPPNETKFPLEVFLDDSDIDIPPPPDVGSSAPSNVQLVNNLLTQLATIFTSSVSTISGGEINQAGASAAFGANSNLATFLVSAFNTIGMPI